MKIAIVQDELLRRGGAEQVALSFHHAYPDAPIFTIAYNAGETYPEFKSCDIRTSWLNPYAQKSETWRKLFYPFGVWAMQALDVTGYDVVLQSTTFCAKYVNIDKKALVITYCHTPFRLVFRTDSYDEISQSGRLKRLAYNLVIDRLRKIDLKAAARTDFFVTNASVVVPRIVAAYHPKHTVAVIPPAVKTENFHPAVEISDYYLVVSRFEPYKKVDLVIEAFNRMPGRKLFIVGKGTVEPLLRSLAGENIRFFKDLDKASLGSIMAGCKALIFPQLEDFGITALEINASGRPVIAYGEGGVLDTMVPYSGDASKSTAVFFESQTAESLMRAIDLFETLKFDPDFIRRNAEKYSEQVFITKIQDLIRSRLEARNTNLARAELPAGS